MGMALEIARRHRDDEAAVLPLINIVFLLLAFFMIAGQLMPSPPFEVDPPSVAAEPSSAPSPVIIHVAADGALAIESQQASRDRIEQQLLALTAGPSTPPVRVVADGQVAANKVIALMQDMEKAGVARVELTTRRP